jgi:hypothetical protein
MIFTVFGIVSIVGLLAATRPDIFTRYFLEEMEAQTTYGQHECSFVDGLDYFRILHACAHRRAHLECFTITGGQSLPNISIPTCRSNQS